MTTTPRIEPRSEKLVRERTAPIPGGRRRVLLDLSPDTLERLLHAVQEMVGFEKIERMIVEALELSR